MTDTMWSTDFYEPVAEARTTTGAASPAIADPRLLRNTLGNFATGVAVLTYRSGDAYHGVTVNSFTSVSLEPPLVLVSIARTSRALTYLLERPFAINIMADTQLDEAMQFAGKPMKDTIEWVTQESAPRLNGTLAYFQCTPWAGYDGGDHVLVLGRVLSHGQADETRPLLFYRGKWSALAVDDDGSGASESGAGGSSAGATGTKETRRAT